MGDTDITLKEYFETLIATEVKRLEDLVSAERELRRARREDDQLAAIKAETDMGRRLTSMNQFRQQLAEERHNYVTLEVIEEQKKAATTLHGTIFLRIERLETRQARLYGALTLISFTVPVLIALIYYFHH